MSTHIKISFSGGHVRDYELLDICDKALKDGGEVLVRITHPDYGELISAKPVPAGYQMHMGSEQVSSECVCKKCGRGPYINPGFADSCCR